jgi:hypothetical protein
MSEILNRDINEIVELWEIEHEQLQILGRQIIRKYTEGDIEAVRRTLEAFELLIKKHFKSEYLTLMEISRHSDALDEMTREAVATFRESFQGMQREILKTLLHYNHRGQDLDEAFFQTFSTILQQLEERVRFEESNLYRLLRQQ